MRLTIFLLFCFCLGAHANGYSQKITLAENNVSLETIFKKIEKQTEYSFVYHYEWVANAKKVNIKVTKASLEDVLKRCFEGQPLTYTLIGNTIVVKHKEETNSNVKSIVNAIPEMSIKGRILDLNNNPIQSASISVQNTTIITVSNNKGEFELKNIPENNRIIITAVGYLKAIVAYENGRGTIVSNTDTNNENIETEGNAGNSIQFEGTSLTIRLARTVTSLNNVVVTGITQRTTNSFTGSARTISGTELKTVSANNVFAAISAYEPSFRIIANNVIGGNINQLPDVQLRGANSFPNLSGELSANPNLPLFILDGFEVPLQRIVDLDMNRISSITILKDASASSIYGSRAANGVMVVTTIAPVSGKIQVTITNDFSYISPDLTVYKLLDAREKLDFETRAGLYSPTIQQDRFIADYLYNQRLAAIESGINTDWRKFPTQSGFSNRTSLLLQGGDNSIRYGLQVAADFQNGVMKGQDRNNYSGQFDISYFVNKFRFSNSLRVFQNKSNESPYGDFSKYLTMNPYWSPFDEQGNIKQFVEDNNLVNQRRTIANPLYDASLHSINRQQYFGFTNNFQLRYNLLPNLFFESNFSITKQEGSTDLFYAAQDSRFNSITDPTLKGSYTVRNDNISSYESLTSANYNFSSGAHRLLNTIAFNIASNSNSYYSIVTQGFPFDRLDNLLFATQYQANSRPTGDEGTVRRTGLVYSGNYSWNDRFLADVSIRRDGSSQFGTDKRFGTFWSTGIGWNLHNENFLRSSTVVNRLKLRGSYGSTGSLNIPAYGAQFRYNFGVNTSYYNELGAALTGLGNPLLQWQNVFKLNIGMDGVFFKEKLNIRMDVYNENTHNTLTQVTLAPSTGFASYADNLGQVQNRGFEFAVGYKILENKAKGLLWSVNVNGFTNENTLTKLSNKLKTANDKLDAANTTQVRPNILLKEGQSMNTIYAVQSLGVDPVTGSEVYLTKDGKPTFIWSAADKVPVGIDIPKWSGNISSNVMYKGIEANLIFNYRFGGQMYNQTLAERVESVNPLYNVDRRAYDLGWSKPGDEVQFTRIGVNKAPTKLTSRFVQDENTVQLLSASIGYNFYRSAFLKKAGFNSLQIRALSNDVFRMSTIQLERGLSNPFARTFTLTIRAGF